MKQHVCRTDISRAYTIQIQYLFKKKLSLITVRPVFIHCPYQLWLMQCNAPVTLKIVSLIKTGHRPVDQKAWIINTLLHK